MSGAGVASSASVASRDATAAREATRPVPTLHQAAGDCAGTVYRLDATSLCIGRRPGNDIVLDHPAVSRVHARIARHGSAMVLTDLSSTAGTKVGRAEVNGSRVLRHGDRISFGPVVVVFEDPAAMGTMEEITQTAVSPGEVPAPTLSPRQADIAALMADGCSNREIAQDLGLTHRTVKSYASEIYARLGVSNRAGAVAVAVKYNLI